jgi:hypothetical protein
MWGLPSRQTATVFFNHWWRAFISGAAGSGFGWAAAVAAIVLGVAAWRFQITMEPSWALPIVAASLAIVIAIVAHLFVVAPHRAIRMLSPFSSTISCGYLPSAYPKHPFEPQKVALRIKNRAYLPRNWVVHVMSVADVHHSFPRLLQEVKIGPGDTVDVPIVVWTFRDAPYQSDPNIMFCGPIGWGWGGNIVSVPANAAYTMLIRLGVPNGVTTEKRLRVKIDGNSIVAFDA